MTPPFQGTGDYREFPSGSSSHTPRPIIACALAMTLGVGSHASMQALTSAESALASLGVTPIGYAALTVTPIALGLVSPILWGRLWDYEKELAYIIAPVGEMFGATLLAAALYMQSVLQPGLLDSTLLGLGFMIISGCKAGVSIAEFSTVGRLCGRHSPVVFACVVLVKHALGILMAWGVPLILTSAPDDWIGIARVQLILLIPHMISVLAGIALARLRPCSQDQSAKADEVEGGDYISPDINGTHSKLAERLCWETLPHQSSARYRESPLCEANVASTQTFISRVGSYLGLAADVNNSEDYKSGTLVIIMIGLWRALAVGTLHAYHSIRIKLMQSRGLPLVYAGAMFATYDTIGIVLLPAIALLCRCTGLKPMLAVVPIVTIIATLVLALSKGDDLAARSSLLVMSVMEVYVPIIPLAMLPANAGSGLGRAFGAIEVMFISTQMAVVFVLGVARTAGGYPGAFVVMAVGFVSALTVSLPAIIYSRDYRPWRSRYYTSVVQ